MQVRCRGAGAEVQMSRYRDAEMQRRIRGAEVQQRRGCTEVQVQGCRGADVRCAEVVQRWCRCAVRCRYVYVQKWYRGKEVV